MGRTLIFRPFSSKGRLAEKVLQTKRFSLSTASTMIFTTTPLPPALPEKVGTNSNKRVKQNQWKSIKPKWVKTTLKIVHGP